MGSAHSAGPVVDVHTHVMPLPVLRRLERDGLADLSRLEQAGSVHIDQRVSGVPRSWPIPCKPAQYDLPARLRLMDEAEVDVHLISAPPFLSGQGLPDHAAATALMRHTNDALAGFAAQCPDRLRPLGTVVLGLPEAAGEARRCVAELGFAGVSIGSRGVTGELDHPDHEPLWRWLAGTGTFTLLHPGGTPAAADRLADFSLTQLLGFPLETTLAASRLIVGGVLDRYDLRLCLCHTAGCLPAVTPRLDLGWRRAAARTTEQPPSAYLRRFYYDTALFDAGRLRRLVDDAGSDRVLLGTDAPFDLADRRPRRTVAALGLAPADELQILGGTAAALLPAGQLDPVVTSGPARSRAGA